MVPSLKVGKWARSIIIWNNLSLISYCVGKWARSKFVFKW